MTWSDYENEPANDYCICLSQWQSQMHAGHLARQWLGQYPARAWQPRRVLQVPWRFVSSHQPYARLQKMWLSKPGESKIFARRPTVETMNMLPGLEIGRASCRERV